MNDICQLLKETRQSKGLTLEEVAQRTYIKLAYLEALEEGHLDRLPAAVHTYGYIRQYARLLGLDGSTLVAQFQQQESAGVRPAPGPAGAPSVTAHSEITEWTGDSMGRLKGSSSNGHATNGHGSNGHHGSANGQTRGYEPATTGEPPPPGPGTPGVMAGFGPEERWSQPVAPPLLSAAEREARNLVQGAEKYADDVLAGLEAEIMKTLQIIHNGRQVLLSRRRPDPPEST